MRSTRGSSRAAGGLALGLLIAAGVEVSAHRMDEYLQAARVGIGPDHVQIEVDLTPGIAVADSILAEIDRNRDGSLSAEEQRMYGSLVLRGLELQVNGTRVPLRLSASTFPETDAVKRGEGTIRLHSTATLPRLPGAVHQLLFRNRHHPVGSVYLANALVPATADVTVTAQRRDANQTELTIDYLLRAAPEKPASAWLLGGIAFAAALSGLLVRPLRSLR